MIARRLRQAGRRAWGRLVAPRTAAREMPGPALPGETDRGEIDDLFLGRLRRVALSSERRLASGLSGEHASHRRGQAIEFADYRSYTPGDDFRQVDWNAYGRLDHLYVKLSEAPERVSLHLLIDGSGSMAFGRPNKLGYARRAAAGLAYAALSHMDQANLIVLRDRRALPLT